MTGRAVLALAAIGLLGGIAGGAYLLRDTPMAGGGEPALSCTGCDARHSDLERRKAAMELLNSSAARDGDP